MAARRTTPLKAVGGTGRARKPPAPPTPPKPKTVKEAAEDGTRRDLLVALRARVASDLDSPNTHPRDVATLTRRLVEIAKDIEALDAAEKVDDVGAAAATPDEEWAVT